MPPIQAFKKWLLNTMVPYIEKNSKKNSKPPISSLENDNYSDLNEDTEYQ